MATVNKRLLDSESADLARAISAEAVSEIERPLKLIASYIVQSPVEAEQLTVQIVNSISTRYQHRDDSIAPIVDLIRRQYKAMPLNSRHSSAASNACRK